MSFLDTLMGKKENQTELEVYCEELDKRGIGPWASPLLEAKTLTILPFLKEVIDKKSTPLGTDEILMTVLTFYITDSYEEEFDSFFKRAKEMYDAILPLGQETDDAPKRVELYKKHFEPDGIFAHDLFQADFYNLFQDKVQYLLVMEKLVMEKSVISQQIPSIMEHALHNRQYFVQEPLFSNHLLSTIDTLKAVVVSGKDPKELFEFLTKQNQHRVGIYDVSEQNLEQIDDLLNSADCILEQLKSQCTMSDGKLQELQNCLQESALKLKNISKSQGLILEEKSQALQEIFKSELAKIVIEEKSQLAEEKDSLVQQIERAVQDKIANLNITFDAMDKNAISQLERIRKTGRMVEQQVKQVLSEHPQLESIVAEYTPITELITSLQKAEEIIATSEKREKPVSMQQGKNSSFTVIVDKEIPSDINHFFDTRIPYTSRFNEIMEKVEQEKENGVLFHQKFPTLLSMIMEDCSPYLWGPSGLGKTYMVEQAFRLLGLDYLPINKILEDYDIIGSMLPNGDYSSPLWYQSYKYGKGAFLDELDSSNSEATIVINSFTSNKKGSFYPFPNSEIVYRHPNFRIVAAGNTAGNGANDSYSDRKRLDESVQQRLMPLYLKPDSRVEERILADYPDWFEFVQNFRIATTNYAKDRDLLSAPGEVTTRDTDQIKLMKDHQSFTDDEILEYQFIEAKDNDYLGFLQSSLDSIYGENKELVSQPLYKKFVKKTNEIRKGKSNA